MTDRGDAVSVQVLNSIHDVSASAWNACAGTTNPFITHAFLAALEDSGSVCAETGWAPKHLAAVDAQGTPFACMPLYLKGHSYGEYVFDWGWAEAFQRAGGRYYPKLQCAVPFSPVTGPRLLVRADAPATAHDVLATAALRVLDATQASSLHVTFATEDDCSALAGHGYMVRMGHQYHWHNRGYGSFDDFLGDLASRKRKAIRKEREAVAASDLVIRGLTGAKIEPRHWDAFYQFYLDTTERKWAHAYLRRTFFQRLAETMGEQVLLVVAETTCGETVAAALNLIGDDTLYGRYWGCAETGKFLHFELCFYRAIDFAIERGLRRVEAGAQGEHKIQRGYLPQPTWSAHVIAHPGLRRAVKSFLEQERPAVEAEIAHLQSGSPFRSDLQTP